MKDYMKLVRGEEYKVVGRGEYAYIHLRVNWDGNQYLASMLDKESDRTVNIPVDDILYKAPAEYDPVYITIDGLQVETTEEKADAYYKARRNLKKAIKEL